jgi:hypothetical protein
MIRMEHLVAAKLFHFLYDCIDHDRTVWFCPDGSAARNSVRHGVMIDDVLPDLIFYFIGGTEPFLAEVKIVERNRVSFCGDGQPEAWHANGHGAHKPMMWVGANNDQSKWYLWENADFSDALTALCGRGLTTGNNKKTLKAPIPDTHQVFDNPRETADAMIAWASANRSLYTPPTTGTIG